MSDPNAASDLRALPAVDLLVRQALERQPALPPSLLVAAARALLDQTRQAIRAGRAAPPASALLDRLLDLVAADLRPTLRPVINATGVILQTNLGRAPLSEAALTAMRVVAGGYTNLEYDLEAGQRGSRSTHLRDLLRRLTGAEDALVVNNNAAAIYLALLALASGRQVLVSRGQAVEIGGGFRIPDVLRQSGATLVEVGTTNRTYARDYAEAITPHTALLMRIHSSNFRIVGFVHEPSLAELASLARDHEVALLDDLGSGALIDTAPFGLSPEPTAQASIAAGADLVAFSGDKLLGGPQAGLIVGRAPLIARLRRHPLARALRVDKLALAGLEATLASYARGTALVDLPIWRMIAASPAALQQRASALADRLAAAGIQARIVPCHSTVGGGALPGDSLPSLALALESDHLDALHARLRHGQPAIVGRISAGQLLLDLRTVQPAEDEALAAGIQAAWSLASAG